MKMIFSCVMLVQTMIVFLMLGAFSEKNVYFFVTGKKLINERLKLHSQVEILTFVTKHFSKQMLQQDDTSHAVEMLLSFFPQDQETGGILHRDLPDGAYAKMIAIEKMNPQMAMGMIVNDELSEKFGVLPGDHFIQVVMNSATASASSSFSLHKARFFNSNVLAQDSPGAIVAAIHGESVLPVSDQRQNKE